MRSYAPPQLGLSSDINGISGADLAAQPNFFRRDASVSG